MGMKKIFNIENLTINTCCPEQPTNCNAIITGLEVSGELTFSVTTTGSQGWNVRVGLYSATLGTYFYADWQVNGINTFVFEIADLQAYFEAQDLQFVVEVSSGDNEEVCDQTFVPLFNTSQVVEYTETGEIELVPELTPGVTCAGNLTHTIVYNNGLLFDSSDLSIDEAGNGTLELGGLPLDDENGIILIAYYCDGILIAILAVDLTLLMFDVRVLGRSAKCEDEVLTATFVLTNHGTNTIPSGTEFDYEFTTDPALTEVVGQVVSGTYTLLVNLAPTETITMSIEYENPECLTGSDITLTITDVPTGYGNFNPATLTDDITYEYVAPPMGLRMLFDDIANAPVVDPTNVGQWNTFYDLPTNGAVFTSVVVAGNQVTLIGGGAMTIKNSLLSGQSYLVEIEDQSSIVIEIEDYAFQSAFAITLVGLQDLVTAGEEGFNGCSLVTTFDFPLLTTLGENFFTNCTSATLINLPLCVNLANNPASITAFQFITGQVITLNIAAVNATNNAGGVHASVAYLIANNTATVNYI